MASQKQLNHLINDYESAFRFLQQAADILIDTESVATEVLGRVGPTSPPAMISTLGEVVGALFRARSNLANAAPTDQR